MEKAERDGLLTWTRSDDRGASRAATVEPPARVERPDVAVGLVDARAPWDAPPPAPVHDEPYPADAAAEVADAPAPWISPSLVVATDPSSLPAERYRLLRTRLEGRENAGRTQLLVVTSPKLGEGKTTTSANLALSMSQELQHRVVLVEADLRRPTLAALFGLPPAAGLVDVLLGTATLEEALVQVPGHQLFILAAGTGAVRSTELLTSSVMQRTIEALRGRFDRIVVDTPPMSLADTHVLARMADGVLLVVRSGFTPKPAVEAALASIDRRQLVGIVLNEVEVSSDAYEYPGEYAHDIAE
jgi:capsular exopolysaccharide synthesis family protein